MRRGLALLSLGALVSCAARAAPIQLLALPEYPPSVARPAAPSGASASVAVEPRSAFVALEGTTWAGPDSDGAAWSFEFRRGGSLHYMLSGSEYENATWKQTGSRVVMETNGHYADFTGTIQGHKMTGSAHNKAGKSWTWEAERTP